MLNDGEREKMNAIIRTAKSILYANYIAHRVQKQPLKFIKRRNLVMMQAKSCYLTIC